MNGGTERMITKRLRAASLRATRQRVALMRLLDRSTTPLSVEALVRASQSAFDTATAYRMLEQFAEAGLVRRVELKKGRALFESSDHHHHHATCTSCGKIVDVTACLPDGLSERVRSTSGFARITDHALEFFGNCVRCAGKKSRKR